MYRHVHVVWWYTQEEAIPFVLGDLGCAGDESSLLQCPASGGFDGIERDYYFIGSRGRYFYDSYEYSCDPSQRSYAKVACGMEDLAGA